MSFPETPSEFVNWPELLEKGSEEDALAWVAAQTRESVRGMFTSRETEGLTPLMVAAKRSARLTQALLPISDAGEKSIFRSQSALTIAAEAGQADCVELLIQVPSHKVAEDSVCDALLTAIFYGHADCVKILAPKADLSHKGRDALLTACVRGQWKCAPFLVNEITAKHAHAQTKMTPLMEIAESVRGAEADRIECLKHVLPFSDTSARNVQRRTALQLAIIEQQWNVALEVAKHTDIVKEEKRWSALDELLKNRLAQPHPEKGALVAYLAKILATDGQAEHLAVAFGRAAGGGQWECADALSEWATPEQLLSSQDLAVARKDEDRIPQIVSRIEAIELEKIVGASATTVLEPENSDELAPAEPKSRSASRI